MPPNVGNDNYKIFFNANNPYSNAAGTPPSPTAQQIQTENLNNFIEDTVGLNTLLTKCKAEYTTNEDGNTSIKIKQSEINKLNYEDASTVFNFVFSDNANVKGFVQLIDDTADESSAQVSSQPVSDKNAQITNDSPKQETLGKIINSNPNALPGKSESLMASDQAYLEEYKANLEEEDKAKMTQSLLLPKNTNTAESTTSLYAFNLKTERSKQLFDGLEELGKKSNTNPISADKKSLILEQFDNLNKSLAYKEKDFENLTNPKTDLPYTSKDVAQLNSQNNEIYTTLLSKLKFSNDSKEGVE